MAKNAEWFKKIFADANTAIPKDSKNREYVVLYKACMDSIRGGENEPGYVQNQLGYNSETLVTKVPNAKKSTKDKVEYFTRAELFTLVFNKALNDVRYNVAMATVAATWGISIEGMRGINSYISGYCGAIERLSDTVVFVASKNDAKVLRESGLEPTKVSKQGSETFSLPIELFTKTILDKKLPLLDPKLEAEKKPTPQISDRHNAFAATYRAKLGKYTQFRTQRLSIEVEGIADGYEW